MLLVSVLAKGLAFLPKYSIDDYFLVQLHGRSLSMLQQGRIGQALLVKLLQALRLEPNYSTLFFVVLALATWSLLALLVVRWWGLKRQGWLPLATGCLIAIHPFTTEIFTFRTALGTCTLALTLFTLLLWPGTWTARRILIGAALFAVTLSIYQIVLHFAVMILLLGAAVGLARYLAAGAALGWSRRWASLWTFDRLRRHRQAALAACIVLGTGAYVAGNQALVTLLRVPSITRTRFLAAGALAERAHQVAELLRHRLLLPDPLIAPATQKLLLLLLVAAAGGLLLRREAWRRRRAAALAWAALGLLAAGLIWSVGVILVLEDFWPAARVMAHTGVFWAGVLAVAWTVSGPRRRTALAGLMAVVILSFIGTDNHILSDQQRINQRDALTANRIVERLESLTRFHDIETVAVAGGNWGFAERIATTDHDMNISAFGAKWAKVQLLREISGYDWKWGAGENEPVPGEAVTRMADDHCRGVEPWPAAESVTVQGHLAIVCLPQPP